ncbi:MAG: multicopper oxidase domain-containing protein, partial [Gemmatimonadaceae bacterium]
MTVAYFRIRTSSAHAIVIGMGLLAVPVVQWSPPQLRAATALSASNTKGTPAVAQANDNRTSAGRLANGVLTLRLEAREGIWHPEGLAAPGVPVYAFATERGAPKVPGPLIRVPAGTEIRATVSNSLPKLMTLRGLQDHGASALDTIDIPAGKTREIRFRATIPGTYYYWARTEGNRELFSPVMDSKLVGALIVDPPGVPPDPRERVMVLTVWSDTLRTPAKAELKEVFGINGLSWPHTERLNFTVGDTVLWRLVNATGRPHPMHLHGFYFDVTAKGNAVRDTTYTPRQIRKGVTELMTAGTTLAMTWIPTRAGNWLLHCHLINHIDARLRLSSPTHGTSHAGNHAEDGMAGLVVGLHVAPKRGAPAIAADPVARKKLRLFVNERAEVYDKDPGYSFILQEGNDPPSIDSVRVPSSTIVVTKDEPTEIVVVNRARAPVSVHWHGIEIESYYDGVGDWSGWRKKVAPTIAPGDSFVVRMTPDRAGTFIYHTHVDELVQLLSGLYGPLIIVESGARMDTTERILLMGDGGPRPGVPPFLNGKANPDSVQ